MKTWGFPPSYSDVAALDTQFAQGGVDYVAAYIFVGTGGDIVWENIHGEPQWFKGAQSNAWYYLGACKILTSGTVNGTPRLTTASNIIWFAVNPKNNTP